VLCASPAYIEKYGTPQSPDDLRKHCCLVYKGNDGAQRWYFRPAAGGQAQVIDVNGPLRSNNAQVLVEAALAGRGLVLFPSWLFSKERFTRGELVKLLPEWSGAVAEIPSQIHLISPENRLRSQKTRAVWDYFLQAIGSPPYWDDLGD
jgi:DNA-binding transcriptional LysR family regulator